MDKDGNTSYSVVRSVESESTKVGISFWPNPATERINIVTNGSVNNLTKAQVFDIAGRKMMETQVQSDNTQLNINH